MDFDFSSMAHRVIDGLKVGDAVSILIAIGYALVAFGSTWLAAKSIKGCAKCSYRGAKWMITPRQNSEMANSILSKLQEARMDGTSLRADPVYMYCSYVDVTRPFSEIRVGGNDVSQFLTRNERKQIYTAAYAIRKELYRTKAERGLREAREKAMAALAPCAAKSTPTNEVKWEAEAKVGAKVTKADHSKDVQARNLCMCGSCVSQRNRAS